MRTLTMRAIDVAIDSPIFRLFVSQKDPSVGIDPVVDDVPQAIPPMSILRQAELLSNEPHTPRVSSSFMSRTKVEAILKEEREKAFFSLWS